MTDNANTKIYDKVIDRAAMIRLYERRVNGKVSVILDEHEARLDSILKASRQDNKKYNSIIEDIDKELTRTYRDVFNITKRSLLDLFRDQASYTYQNFEAIIGKIWKPDRPAKAVAANVVLDTPLYGDTRLAAGWGGVSAAEQKRLEAIIRKGIAENKTVDELALEVRKGNVHNITRNQSRGLVVTAVTSVTTQADHAVYRANEKALAGWQYVAVLDARTTPLCAHRDGHVYPISDRTHLPPAHFHCRSTTVPVFKSWSDISELEGVANVRKTNLSKLTSAQQAFYDGQTPLKESYNDWLLRQPRDIQFRHLGDYKKVDLFNTGELTLDKFTNPEGNSIGIRELRAMTDSGYTLPGDTKKFAAAKAKLDAMQLGINTPEDLLYNDKFTNTLRDYFLLQTKELDGTLSLTNYRGMLLHTKKAAKNRVLTSPPKEEQLKFNPVTGRYEDIRLYQPNIGVYSNNMRLVRESQLLLQKDKDFIVSFVESLENQMSLNERAVVTDNLRILFSRYRQNPEPWANFKAVIQSQIKFDVMNVSDAIETQLRKDSDVLKKLQQSSYLDPVLGPVQLQDLHDNFIPNIIEKNDWEDKIAPKIAKELYQVFDRTVAIKAPLIWERLSASDFQQFYLRFAHRLSLADSPDIDQLAVSLGRDLYNIANLNGNRNLWFKLGKSILETKNVKKFYEIETFGVQKRRMKSRLSGQYFGPYYDTQAYNIRVTDPRIQSYARLTRKVDLGLRVAVTEPENRLLIREGFKTYFVKRGLLGQYDTRIPITSTSSFSDFPVEFVDKDLADALNWASQTQYKIDPDFYNFVNKMLYFVDDKGKAKYYDDLNEYRKYIAARGDAYERFKAMEWLKNKDVAFSNNAFIDHRARIYDRGLISPQSGESFRPFLNTAVAKNFSKEEFLDLQDQIGAFLGGLDDYFEGNYNSLTITGRQKIAAKLRPEIVKIGNHMRRAKPADIRAILESEFVNRIDGEEQGKFFRFAIEMAKIDNFLRSPLSDPTVVQKLSSVKGIELFGSRKKGTYRLSSDVDIVIEFENSDFNNIKNSVYYDANKEQVELKTKEITKALGINPETNKPYDIQIVGRYELRNFNKNILDLPKEIDPYSSANLERLNNYKIALALEQDASSSGAQIIALTTRNKQLAELSNVVPTNQKRRLYDEIAAATYNDPLFRKLNEKLGLSEKDLRKAAKAQNMVTFYGAGERTGIFNVEGKLSKVLGKDKNTLVVKAADRDIVLNEISARAARYERFDPETAAELKELRQNVRDVFNKGIDPGDEIMEQLYFLDPKTKDLVDKLSHSYERVVTPDDFKVVAQIMSGHLAEQVPILKDFTKFFGRLAEDFLTTAKPSNSNFDWESIAKIAVLGTKKKGYMLPDFVSKILGIKPGEPVSENLLKRFGFWKPDSNLSEIIYGVKSPEARRTGAKYLKVEFAQVLKLNEVEVFFANKLPKSWTNVPWVNFDGKTIEQNFTQQFEERLRYKDKDGNWFVNILQVPQKTEATWWEQVINKSGKINDIANATKARTAFAVNGNHSNDAVIVKKFHLWGKENNVPTSTIHDAFFANAAEMLKARNALRKIYAKTLDKNVIKMTLDEMKARGLSKELYDKYLEEAIESGLIPVVGKSRINGVLMKESDILTVPDILKEVPSDFKDDYGWYGVG